MATTLGSKLSYLVRPMEDQDQDAVLELQRQALGEAMSRQRTAELWQWKHERNPFGRSFTLLAIAHDGQVIGLRTLMRWEFQYNGRTVKAARAVDTATHPAFQRMGIFARLTSDGVAALREQGTDLIFNTPNNMSLPGYLKLGWQRVGTVRPLIKVLNYRRFLTGLGLYAMRRRAHHAQSHHELDTFYRSKPSPVARLVDDEAIGALLEHDGAIRGPGLVTANSISYLRWRYAEHPTIPYTGVALQERGVLQAGAVLRTNVRFGLKEMVVSDFFLRQPKAVVAKTLVGLIAGQSRADYLIAYATPFSLHHRLLRAAGFLPAYNVGMVLVVNPLSSWAQEADLLDLGRWGIGLGSLEFF